ncbi:IPExxxVDY family protein [Aquimarina sp. U1-2]|uniref:IPExxxVDY family protein n=1 Tax=Aquimarina sp. U1-2 TaxID=2823141 RepID=UPI001AEC9B06|nr:IPExxxVDY family protein [Aquimarina sp. U1-2]MBP2831186.1 IPExxxVDY family protein [Aquimarina sp. U1-2]
MAIQKLVLETFEDDSYELIAIHSSLPSYRLAFLLNKTLGISLFRKKKDIHFKYKDGIANFPIYQYEDHLQYNTYALVANKFRSMVETDIPSLNRSKNSSNHTSSQSVSTITPSNKAVSVGLFAAQKDAYTTKYLIPELKHVDYFLKITVESSTFLSKPKVSKILDISQVITAYTIDYSTLKSKNNLILE